MCILKVQQHKTSYIKYDTVYSVPVAEWSSPHMHTFPMQLSGRPAGHSHHSMHHSMNQASCSTKHIGANCPDRIFKVAASEQLGYSKKLIKPGLLEFSNNKLYTR